MRRFMIVAAILSLLLGTGHSARAGQATFDFSSLPFGDSTPFSLTNNGLTASFSSPGDPGGFEIFSSFFETISGVLLSPGPAGKSGIPLNIDFSQSVNSISLQFALEATTIPPTTTLDLSATLGGSPAGGTSATGTVPPPPSGGNPEGVLNFSGLFNSVDLSTVAPNFAIGQIVVNYSTAAVPEPSSLLMSSVLGVALLGGALLRRRIRG